MRFIAGTAMGAYIVGAVVTGGVIAGVGVMVWLDVAAIRKMH